MRRADLMLSRPRSSAWTWLVVASACVLVGATAVMVVWWQASRETRVASYAVSGLLNGISLDLGGASVAIVGGGDERQVEVRHSDEATFGQHALARRILANGVLRLQSRCPRTVLGSCSSTYRLRVPDNVPVTVQSGSGDVTFRGFRGSARIDTASGDITVSAFCGFSLQAHSDSGEIRTAVACPLETLSLRSRTGAIHALVPPARYRIDAETDSGTRRVHGLTSAEDAAFQIQALSTTGDVDIEAVP